VSQENVEHLRRAQEVLSSGESPQLLRTFLTKLLHADVEWHDQRELPGATVHHGIEAVERHFAAAREALNYDTPEVLDTLHAGRCVIEAYRFRAHGRSSGATTERDAFYVWCFRGAKVERVEIFGTRAEALKAVGLGEDTA
jgi:ketosteroid isomerase-like protein